MRILNYNNRGLAYRRKGEYDKAIAAFNKIIDLYPGYAVAYNNRGRAHRSKGEYDKAIADFNKAIQLDPNLAAVGYQNLGYAYKALGMRAEAIADFQKCIDLLQDHPSLIQATKQEIKELRSSE